MRVLICSLALWLGGTGLGWAESLWQGVRGEVRPGHLLVGQVAPGTRVWLGERELPVAADGRFPFGAGRDAVGELVLTLRQGDRSRVVHLPLLPRDYLLSRVDGVPQSRVTPPPEVTERIRREAAQIGAARQRLLSRMDFADPFQWPAIGRISGVYGSQRIYNGQPGSPHLGLDIAVPSGTVLRAPAAAEVTFVHDDMYFNGGTLVMDHGYGVASTFIHLSEILVQPGEQVRAGQPVARSGATGRASGPHLHWALNWFEERLDPRPLLGPMPER